MKQSHRLHDLKILIVSMKLVCFVWTVGLISSFRKPAQRSTGGTRIFSSSGKADATIYILPDYARNGWKTLEF